MCVGIPGQIVELLDPVHGIARADVGGVERKINVQLLQDGEDRVGAGDWVLIHVGFAMSKIDEQEAAEILGFLSDDGQPEAPHLAGLPDGDGG